MSDWRIAAYREAYRQIARRLLYAAPEPDPIKRIKEIINRPISLDSKGLPRSPATTPSEMSREGSRRDWRQGAQTFAIEQYGVADQPLSDSQWREYVEAVQEHIAKHGGQWWRFG